MSWDANAVQIEVVLGGIEPAVCAGWSSRAISISASCPWCCRPRSAGGTATCTSTTSAACANRPAEFCEPEMEGDRRCFDEQAVSLRDFSGQDVRLIYLYDLGDSWRHLVRLERLLALDPAPRQARCLDGARARPPEDVGGTHGYARFLEIIGDPGDPEQRDTLRWAGGHFDPEWFDRDMVDHDVRNALRANRRIRLHQPRPRGRARS